jgi:hypothetical protein
MNCFAFGKCRNTGLYVDDDGNLIVDKPAAQAAPQTIRPPSESAAA